MKTSIPYPEFPPDFSSILNRIDQFDPVAYGKTRNYVNGTVSYLSPYLSRGVISTRFVANRLIERGFSMNEMEKFIQELAWRDYWQEVWLAHDNGIEADLRQPQPNTENQGVPHSLVHHTTGIEAIDWGVKSLYDTGYMHNHLRMYTAMLTCNLARYKWLEPARWMYYHLFDADWASNALSWQWVAGSNSSKQYWANQENINRFTGSSQTFTFLDVPYEVFNTDYPVPDELNHSINPDLPCQLPASETLELGDKPVLIYDFYNMDPLWLSDIDAHRVLLLEPDTFQRYPVSKRVLSFLLSLRINISQLKVVSMSFNELKAHYPNSIFHYKRHPLTSHWKGIEHKRETLSSVTGYFPSFFAFWKRVAKEF